MNQKGSSGSKLFNNGMTGIKTSNKAKPVTQSAWSSKTKAAPEKPEPVTQSAWSTKDKDAPRQPENPPVQQLARVQPPQVSDPASAWGPRRSPLPPAPVIRRNTVRVFTIG